VVAAVRPGDLGRVRPHREGGAVRLHVAPAVTDGRFRREGFDRLEGPFLSGRRQDVIDEFPNPPGGVGVAVDHEGPDRPVGPRRSRPVRVLVVDGDPDAAGRMEELTEDILTEG
jgi:hypothetical protein